jgi:PEP-CTERM motif
MSNQTTPSRWLAALLLAAAAGHGQAADFTLQGDIAFHKDIVQIDFMLAAAGSVTLWTDSWQAGVNFDPTGALWLRSDADYSLLALNDDNVDVPTGPGSFDVGFLLPTLAAGSYRLTLAASFNEPNGTLLSQGFSYDGQAPIALADWTQPSADPNFPDQKGGYWRLNLSGVDQASVVPEPSVAWLLALGLGGLGLLMRQRKQLDSSR